MAIFRLKKRVSLFFSLFTFGLSSCSQPYHPARQNHLAADMSKKTAQDSSFIQYQLTDHDALFDGTFVIGYRKHLVKNGVSHINQKSGCSGNAFEINRHGLVTKMYNGTSFYKKLEYTDKGKILGSHTYDHSTKTPVWSKVFKYSENGILVSKRDILYNKSGKTEHDSTITHFSTPLREEVTYLYYKDSLQGRKNDRGFLKEQVKRDMHFPCGIELNGTNSIHYFYNPENLIDSIQITNNSGARKLTFTYEYQYQHKQD